MRYEVQFQPVGRRGYAEAGKNLLEVAAQMGVNIRADCGGKGTCGKCRVIVAADTNGLPSPGKTELRILKSKLDAGFRLACQTPLCKPMQVTVPEESLPEITVVLTEGKGVPFNLEPAVQKYHFCAECLTSSNIVGDAERLLQALELTYGQKGVTIALPVLRKLPNTLRDADYDVTVTVSGVDRREIIDIEPGYVEDSYGIAVDIGTTTVALYLTNLHTGEVTSTESATNPQVAYGADVMSRIYHTMKERQGRHRMRQAIVTCVNQLITKACAQSGAKPQQIAEMTIVGNTAMHHLFLGVEAQYLAKAPFAPAVRNACDLRAQDLGLAINPAANVHMLPNEAGFVGSDNVGVLIATEPFRQKEVTLIIDIGTNGEMVLGNQELGLLSCSVAAGPAFEGGHIRFGMRAAPGAIEHVCIDPASYEVKYHSIGEVPPRGVCGSGIIETVAELLRTKLLLPNGLYNAGVQCPRLRHGDAGSEFVLEWSNGTALGEDIVITQGDIREVQLAKGAFHAGIKILMKHLGIQGIEKVLLAGAFGSHIDPKSAMDIGLFPSQDPQNVIAVGNAAGYGARMALLSKSKRSEAMQIARQVHYIELAADPDFQSAFVEGTRFPSYDIA